jgi:hydrogenase nickel incorporation protein HypB
MCTTCGCSDGAKTTITDLSDGHEHSHGHGHGHDHHHEHDDHEHNHNRPGGQTIVMEQEVLAKNDRLAELNRDWLAGRGILAVNLMSSPGSGKTTLLERTIRDLDGRVPVSVIEGDQETVLDAARIRSTGRPVIQINTGAGCHLDAEMLADGLRTLDPEPASLLMIENVGNLVCPALFDLGEAAKIVIMSVTEGDDKPLKYPHMFRAADLMIVNKVDLAPHVPFDIDACIANARRIKPGLESLQVSALRGDGLDAWYDWLTAKVGSPAA